MRAGFPITDQQFFWLQSARLGYHWGRQFKLLVADLCAIDHQDSTATSRRRFFMQLSMVRNGGAATALRAVSGVIVSTLLCGLPALGQNADLQQKVAALKQATAENKQRLHQYQWTETVQLTLKGDPKPPKQNLCQYGPDGQVQKTPIGDQQ